MSFTAPARVWGDSMLGSGIIDVAIGLAFVFGVTAALSSVFTELIARFLGLRGAYLLRGLRELLDSGNVVTDLGKAEKDYQAWQSVITGSPARGVPAGGASTGGTPAGRTPAKPPQSATAALLGSPVLRGQGLTGQISNRKLILRPAGQPSAPAGRVARLVKAAANLVKAAAKAVRRAAKPPKEAVPGQAQLKPTDGKRRPWSACRSLPAYISATSFTDAVIDLMVPDAGGQTMDAIKDSLDSLQKNFQKKGLPESMSPLVKSLQALVTCADGDIKRFRTSVENWYDDHMARVSGWYKRRVAKITFLIGAILVLLLNVNTLTIGRTMYSNSVVRTAVSSVAAKATSCPPGETKQACLTDLQAQLSAATQAGLPIGWGTVAACAAPKASCNWLERRGIYSPGGSPWQILLVLGGFLITIIALTPGARFWFDLLGKLGSLRSTGPKPASP